jgi:hypothetical protein
MVIITISIEIHFTTVYTLHGGSWNTSGAASEMYPNTDRNHSQLKPLRRREGLKPLLHASSSTYEILIFYILFKST